ASGAIKRVAPGITQAVGPNLGARIGRAEERVVRRYTVREAGVHVDTEHLAQQGAQILRVPVGVAGAAPVTQPDIEVAVRPENQVPTIVVGGGLSHVEQRGRDGGVSHVGVGGHLVTDDVGVAVAVGVVDVKVT